MFHLNKKEILDSCLEFHSPPKKIISWKEIWNLYEFLTKQILDFISL